MNARVSTVGAGWRGLAVISAFVLVAGALSWRALDLEIFENQFLLDQGAARHLRVVTVPAHRGMITDRNGRPLAVSTPVDSIWVNPQEFTDSGRIGALARALNMSAHTIRAAIATHPDRKFVYLRRDMSPEDAQRVLALNLAGIYVEHEYRRYYPTGEVTSHVLGFTNIDDVGQEGLELAYNKWLHGKPGAERVIKDRLGHVIQEVASLRDPRPGRDLAASIDLRIQYLAYRDLKAAVQAEGAKSGSIVVLDPNTGEVIAMANQPSFNPNNRGDYKAALYRNRAVTDVFEPGSSFKPFMIASALETGRYTPASEIDTSPGWIVVDGYTINDERDYGVINLTTLLEKSSNVGASKIALSLTPRHIWQTLSALGFGSYTGSGFPGERTGKLRPYTSWHRAGQAAISYGYGVSVTTLQLARAYAAIATGGILRPVSFLRLKNPPPGTRVLPRHVADELRVMLESVVTQAGTGTLAEVANYRVSGKTGTARKAAGGGYSDRYTSVFCGMIPAEHPRLVAVVVVNGASEGDYYGGLVSAPVFSKVMTGAMRILNVPPDDIAMQATAAVVHLGGARS